MYHAGETAFKIAADLRLFGGRLDYVVVDHAVMPCSVDFDLLSLGFGRTGFHLPPVFVLPRERVCFSSVQVPTLSNASLTCPPLGTQLSYSTLSADSVTNMYIYIYIYIYIFPF